MLTTTHVERIARALLPYRNKIAYNAILPPHQRPANVNYEERMKKSAAVLVPLCNVDGVASILFTVRSRELSTHAAQVAFPGGHVDLNETIEQAALRELGEETNLTARVLGQWMAARAYTGTMVTPVVGVLPNMTQAEVKESGKFAPGEVAETFSLPILEHLARRENRVADEYFGPVSAPRFLGGPQPIWGLTGFFLEGILRDVLAPSLGFAYPVSVEERREESVSM